MSDSQEPFELFRCASRRLPFHLHIRFEGIASLFETQFSSWHFEETVALDCFEHPVMHSDSWREQNSSINLEYIFSKQSGNIHLSSYPNQK